MIDLEKIESENAERRRIRDAATKGPWSRCGSRGCTCGIVLGDGGEVYVHVPPRNDDVDPVPTDEMKLADSTLIGYCRDDIAVEAIDALVAEVKRLDAMVGCVVRNAAHVDDTTPRDEPGPLCGPTWAKVGHLLGLGSTSAAMLCRKHDVDPNFDCAKESA